MKMNMMIQELFKDELEQERNLGKEEMVKRLRCEASSNVVGGGNGSAKKQLYRGTQVSRKRR